MPERRLRRRALPALLLAAAALLTGCEKVDDQRIPPLPVRVEFRTQGVWELYGVAGATDHRSFIKSELKPSGFPYTALMETGYGGVLLVSDILGDPKAYDLSCPVEVRQDVRIKVDPEENIARCPKCGSTYDIFANYGQPLSGPASQHAYALTQYAVTLGSAASGCYMLITRR